MMLDAIGERLASWARGIPQGPYRVQAHLTNFCNLDCVFCPTRTLVPKQQLKRKLELDASNWLRLVDESKRLGVAEWHLCGGGEPLLFKDVALPVVRRIKEAGCRGEVITNGAAIDEEMAMLLVSSGWEVVTASLDGPDARTNDPLRGDGSFEKILEGVERLVRKKKAANSPIPRLSFHIVVCNRNHGAISELVKLAGRRGVQEVLVNALNVWSDEVRPLVLQDEELEGLRAELKRAAEVAGSLNIGNNFDSFLQNDLFKKANVMQREMRAQAEKDARSPGKLSSAPCFYPWYNLSIFADGTARPCFLLREGGSRVQDTGLGEAWLSPYFENVRSRILSCNLGEDCSRCNPWSFGQTQDLRRRLMSEGF